MKKLLFAALLLSSTSIFAQKKADDIAKLSTETYDFGKVKQNVPPTATITVTNIGTEPLLIEQATPSCGCTVSDYTKSPIAPGKTGTIKATYNAAAVGQFNKTLTVKFAGADDVKFVKLTGEVLTPAAYDALKTTKESVNKTAKTKKEVTSKS
jgi:membrane peptidoglycan carboxypeptidase